MSADILWSFLLQGVPAVERPAANFKGLLAPGLEHVIELSDRAFRAPERQQRRSNPGVRVGRIVLKVDGCRRAVVLADRLPGRGIQIATQILLKEHLAGRARRLALALDVRAQEELRIR